jgi:hypothetical protein
MYAVGKVPFRFRVTPDQAQFWVDLEYVQHHSIEGAIARSHFSDLRGRYACRV